MRANVRKYKEPDLGELRAITHDELVGGDQNVELERHDVLGEDARALLLGPDIEHDAHSRKPPNELALQE